MIRIELKSAEDVENLVKASASQPERYFVIFKHSPRCGTSRMALNQFESAWNLDKPVYIVNVIESRTASNTVTGLLGIGHESPQVLVIQNGRCIYDNSHSGIDAREIMQRAASEPA